MPPAAAVPRSIAVGIAQNGPSVPQMPNAAIDNVVKRERRRRRRQHGEHETGRADQARTRRRASAARACDRIAMPTTTRPIVAATYGIADSRTMVAEPRLLIDCTSLRQPETDAVERNHDAEIGQRRRSTAAALPSAARSVTIACPLSACSASISRTSHVALVGAQPLRVGGTLGHVDEDDRRQQDRRQAFDQKQPLPSLQSPGAVQLATARSKSARRSRRPSPSRS